MNLGLYLDLGVVITLMTCLLLGYIRGFVLAALGLLIFVNIVFFCSVLVTSTLPATIYFRSTINPIHKTDIESYNAQRYIIFTIYAVGIGIISPLAGEFMRIITRQIDSDLRATGIGRVGGAVIGLVHGSTIVISAYVIAMLIRAPQDWPSNLRQAYSLALIYELGMIASEVLLPDNMRPDINVR